MKQKTINSTLVFSILAVPVLMTSCYVSSPYVDPYIVDQSRQKKNTYYVPSAPNTPLLSKKNDLAFSVMKTSGTKFDGLEAQTAFLPTKHLGIIGSYSSLGNKEDIVYMKYRRFELGAGYVRKLSKSVQFETYAGFGKGKITNFHFTGFSKEDLSHFFIQPAIAINNEKQTLQFGIVSKFSGVNFNVADTTFNTDREPFSAAQLFKLYNQPFHIIWEPGFVFRVGWKEFLFHTGYSFSSDMTDPATFQSKGNFSLGLSMRFNTSPKEKLAK